MTVIPETDTYKKDGRGHMSLQVQEQRVGAVGKKTIELNMFSLQSHTHSRSLARSLARFLTGTKKGRERLLSPGFRPNNYGCLSSQQLRLSLPLYDRPSFSTHLIPCFIRSSLSRVFLSRVGKYDSFDCYKLSKGIKCVEIFHEKTIREICSLLDRNNYNRDLSKCF